MELEDGTGVLLVVTTGSRSECAVLKARFASGSGTAGRGGRVEARRGGAWIRGGGGVFLHLNAAQMLGVSFSLFFFASHSCIARHVFLVRL